MNFVVFRYLFKAYIKILVSRLCIYNIRLVLTVIGTKSRYRNSSLSVIVRRRTSVISGASVRSASVIAFTDNRKKAHFQWKQAGKAKR